VEGEQVAVLDEIVLSRATTQQACEEFQNRFPEHAAGVTVYADASGAHMQTTGASDLGVLKKFFRSGEYGAVEFRVPRSNPAVRDRLQAVNAGMERVKIDARCKELIKDLEQVVYKENSQVIDKDRDPKRTHLSDALGYLMWQQFRAAETVGERGTRLI
jgi:D-serine deaminase-like pyridoxal phosphate-dependent protein